MKGFKNKKALAVAGVAGLGVIGGVIAYNHDAISFNNIFGVGDHLVSFTDEFVAPETWQPCQSVDKKVTVTNDGSDDVAVRVKFSEYWRTANSQTSSDDHSTSDLSLTFDKSGTQSPIAVITQLNPNDWTYNSNDGWYYYKEDLAPNATTSAFLGSVMMDCDFNMVGSIQYSQDGLTGESQPTAYANATYHIFVTGETIDATKKDSWTPAAPAPYEADCDDPSNDLLYDKIACASNGTDEDISYNTTQSASAETGLGVNTLASSVNDPYATYYYRGNVTDNNVLWSDQCWKIMRTTETGGVKMVWMGEATNGQCQSTTASTGIIANNKSYNPASDGLSYAGYTYGTVYSMSQAVDPSATNYQFANDVTWDGAHYTLTNPVSGAWASTHADAAADHHYFCLDGSASCATVAYVWALDETDPSGMWPWYISLSGGTTIETLPDSAYADTTDSIAKTTIDNWYSTTIPSARRNDLEDTVFCNDRTFGWGSLIGKDEPISTYMDRTFVSGYSTANYATLQREEADIVSLSCSARDSYTVASGKLTYPVALMTIDEARLAGAEISSYYGAYNYLHDYGGNDLQTWTMSPAGFDTDGGVEIYTATVDYTFPYDSGNYEGFSPVVSLKFGAKFTGAGTAANPYLVSF